MFDAAAKKNFRILPRFAIEPASTDSTDILSLSCVANLAWVHLVGLNVIACSSCLTGSCLTGSTREV